METAQNTVAGVVQLERNSTAASTPPPEYGVSDEHFIRNLKRLKELRSFLIEQAVCPPGQASLVFGQLNILRFDSAGRMPTEQEWSLVESLTQELFGFLTPPLRRRFLLGNTPQWITWVAIVFAIIAVVSLVASLMTLAVSTTQATQFTGAEFHQLPLAMVPLYVFWLLSLGAIGSIAFIGMNALSVQEDATFDLTNARLMCLRITLGALFALVLALPFGFRDFVNFCADLKAGSANASFTMQAVMLLLPFILGFSTSLVIMVLNRLVDAVQTFFGKVSTTVPTT
jgi:hypothetical protein